MTEDELIEKVLIRCKEAYPGGVSAHSAVWAITGNRDDQKAPSKIKDILLQSVLCTLSTQSDTLRITTFATDIMDSGGYIAYLDVLKRRQQKDAIRQQKEDDKLHWDLKLSKWQVKTFWYWFGGAIIGGLMGAISLLGQLNLLHLPQIGMSPPTSIKNTGSVSSPPLDSVKTHPKKQGNLPNP